MKLNAYEEHNVDLIRQNLIHYWHELNSIKEGHNMLTRSEAVAQIDEITRNLQKTCEFTTELSEEIKTRRDVYESMETN